uniref:Protoporphyrinogen IX oxidase n=1 Tax=Arundo donax TaxID=35708 RepID=A0A0A9E1C7_ARUDO
MAPALASPPTARTGARSGPRTPSRLSVRCPQPW